jgi:hypothetical protein
MKWLVTAAVVVFSALLQTPSNAQSKMFQEVKPSPLARFHLMHQSLNAPADSVTVRKFLETHLPVGAGSIWKCKSVTESPSGLHFVFDQYFGCHRIFNSQVKVNCDDRGNVRSLFDNSYSTEDWNQVELENGFTALANQDMVHRVRGMVHQPANLSISRVIHVDSNMFPNAALEIIYNELPTHRHGIFLLNRQFEVLQHFDLNCYAVPDTPVTATVFNPDPLTTAGVDYGGNYVDSANMDLAVLNNEREWVEVQASFSSGSFHPANAYCVVLDFDAPNIPPSSSTTDSLVYTRSQSGFEEVNALYHIHYFQEYVQSLGFSNLCNYPIEVDVHALGGADNSMFSPATNPPRLFFGDGGVDDAEDADVIVHEYGHALSYCASPGTNLGLERKSLDEGLGDYLAASYSRRISPFRWDDIFTWDGHNEFWNGRSASTEKIYPDDVNSSIHQNGEIWSTALMKIWEVIGYETTDALVLQALYSFATNMSMSDAAWLVLQADTLLNGGANSCAIINAFTAHGLLETTACSLYDPAIAIHAGEDFSVCPGTSFMLVAESTDANLSYQWQPDNGLSQPDSMTSSASLTATTTFTVTATTPSGYFNFDTVTVTVLECLSNILIEQRTEFATAQGALVVKVPFNTTSWTMKVMDMRGSLLTAFDFSSNTTFEWNGIGLPRGVYIISIETPTLLHNEKIVRLR